MHGTRQLVLLPAFCRLLETGTVAADACMLGPSSDTSPDCTAAACLAPQRIHLKHSMLPDSITLMQGVKGTGQPTSTGTEQGRAVRVMQVMILQGIILTVTLLCSLAVGLFMMHAVGTPTRFETPKEAARQD